MTRSTQEVLFERGFKFGAAGTDQLPVGGK